MSIEIIDFKTPSKPFEFEVRGFVVLSFNLHGTTLIELAVYELTTFTFYQTATCSNSIHLWSIICHKFLYQPLLLQRQFISIRMG